MPARKKYRPRCPAVECTYGDESRLERDVPADRVQLPCDLLKSRPNGDVTCYCRYCGLVWFQKKENPIGFDPIPLRVFRIGDFPFHATLARAQGRDSSRASIGLLEGATRKTRPSWKKVTAMRLRQVAALALVGWYLMVPPWPVRTSAPLGQWTIVKSFDTATDCEAELSRQQAAAKVLTKRVLQNSAQAPKETAEFAAHWHWATCVATDDPRLTEK
jgi:hypothetical protein